MRTARHKLVLNAAPHFPFRMPSDLEDSPAWASYREEARRGKVSAAHQQLFNPTRPLWELYDLAEDPDEFNNVAADSAYRQMRAGLLLRLSDWMPDTYDFLPPAYDQRGKPEGRT